MLSGVTVSCFVFSYLVVMCMEAARVYLKIPGRNTLLICMLVAGLFAHTIFLVNTLFFSEASNIKLLADWFQWSVVAAWCLTIAYMVLVIRNPANASGLFLIPLILALIGLGTLMRGGTPFVPTSEGLWQVVHGISLLVGTMFICFGVAFGMMYLLQSMRLKSKGRRKKAKLKLPTLEFLQSMNRLSLFATTLALAFGMLSGVALNLQRSGSIDWLSPGILSTVALFVWTLIATVLEISAKSSLGGRRSAYLVIANFVFMLAVLGVVLVSSHGQGNVAQKSTSATESIISEVNS